MGLDINKITSSNAFQSVSKKASGFCEKIGDALEKSPKKDTFGKIIQNIEPTGGNNAFIGMAGLMLGTVIAPRVFTAAKRNPDDKEGTKDEIKEILFRDVQTVAIVLFALKSINSLVAGKTSKLTGIPMTNKPYQKVFENTEKGLKGIQGKAQEFIQNPVDKLKIAGKNLLDTLHPTDGVRALTNDEFVAKFSGYNSIEEVQKLFNQIGEEKGNPQKVFNKVMNILIENQKATMNSEKARSLAGFSASSKKAQTVLKELEALKEKGLEGLNDEKLNEKVKEQIVDLFQNKDNELVMSAKKLNAGLRTGALLFESAYLGFGLPALNQQRLKKKYLNGEQNAPQAGSVQQNNASADKFNLTSKNVSENEVKVFNQFIK